MDVLTKFEDEFDKPQSAWTRAQWRKVALTHAGMEIVQPKGRRKKTEADRLEDLRNVSAAKYQRDVKIGHKEVKEITYTKDYPDHVKKTLAQFVNVNLEPVANLKVGSTLIKRAKNEKISKKHALTQVVSEASKRESSITRRPSVASLVKQIQKLEKNQRKK